MLGKDANLQVGGNLVAEPGSKLVVDARGLTNNDILRRVATFGGTTTAFAPENVAFLKDEGSAAAKVIYKITATGIKMGVPQGMMLIFR